MTLNNNFVFLNIVIDAMGQLWILWHFNGVINLGLIASVTIAIEEFSKSGYEWL